MTQAADSPGPALKRRRWARLLVVVAVPVVGLLLWKSWYARGAPYVPPPMAFDGDSTALRDTVVVPTLDTPVPTGKNIVWCASFQLAWNCLRADVVKAPLLIDGVQAVADRLNAAPVDATCLDPASYFATAGFVRDGVLADIHKTMAQRFPSVPQPKIDASPDAIVAYACLQAGVKFTVPFFENPQALPFVDSLGRSTPVLSFGNKPAEGVPPDELAAQVRLLYCAAANDPAARTPAEYAIDPCVHTTPYQLVLAAVPLQATLAQTLSDLDAKIAARATAGARYPYSEADRLMIPSMRWRILHRFQELEGIDRRVRNTGFETYWVARAEQMIDFTLDRSGAQATSVALLVAKALAGREFRFDRPFLLYLKKRGGGQPFFVAWVDNAELLAKPADR